jgi:hypothetical protein
MPQIGDPLGRTGELCLQSQPLEAIEPAHERIRAAIACATALLLSVGPFAYSETASNSAAPARRNAEARGCDHLSIRSAKA